MFVLVYFFAYAKLSDIRKENIKIRNWTTLTNSLEQSTVIAKNMQLIVGKLISGEDPDALYFQYLDNSNRLQTLIERIKYHPHTNSYSAEKLGRLESLVTYRNKLDLPKVKTALAQLIPFLDTSYRDAHARKRFAYIRYYDKVNRTTSLTIEYAAIGLAISVLFCIALIFWSCSKSRNPLNRIATLNQRIADMLNIAPTDNPGNDVLGGVQRNLERIVKRLTFNSSPDVLIDSTEQERSRIARDMHDQALSDLTNVSREIESIQPSADNNELQQQKTKLLNEITRIQEGVRKIIDDLHPQELDLIGLGAAIQSHLEKYCSADNLPRWKTHIDPDACAALDKTRQLHLYRICLEAINNILKHARCDRYEISLVKSGNRITLLIEDNGMGFDVERIQSKNRHGILNIRERANLINGTARWVPSRFSSGCRVELTLTLQA